MTGRRRADRIPRDAVLLWLLPALLVGAVLALYWPSLPYPFEFDDFANLVNNPSIRVRDLDLRGLLEITGQTASIGANRPVAFWSFALNYAFGRLDPWGYRLVNVLVHAANAWLVFLLVRRLTARAPGRRAESWAPFFAALLWAVHPLQTNAVVNVVQRMTSLATLFYLAGFLSYLKGREGRRPLWFAASGLLFAAACRTKEIAYVFPFALLLYEGAFSPGLRAWVRERPWAVALFLAGAFSLFPLALSRYGGDYGAYGFTWGERLLTELRVVARYLGLIAVPHPSRLVVDYAYPVSTSLLSPPSTSWALAFHLGALTTGAWALVRRPLYGFALLGFYLHLVIESTVVPLDLIFEHRTYLPSVFLFAGAAGLAAEASVQRLLGSRGAGAAFGLALLLAATWGTWCDRRLRVWRDPIALWNDVREKQPDNWRAYGNLAQEHYARGELDVAWLEASQAVELSPRRALDPLLILGAVASRRGDFGLALGIYSNLLRRGFRHHMVFYDIGLAEEGLGRLSAALAAFQEALVLEPRLEDANGAAARVCLRLGRVAEAREYLRRELQLNPGYVDRVALTKLLGDAPR